jgi:hypothetical protein
MVFDFVDAFFKIYLGPDSLGCRPSRKGEARQVGGGEDQQGEVSARAPTTSPGVNVDAQSSKILTQKLRQNFTHR